VRNASDTEAKRLAERFGEDLRLMEDLGWEAGGCEKPT
jgi:hypothetical protein